MDNILRLIFTNRKNLSIVLLLIVSTVFLNNIIFSQQLNYGFRDQDWVMLYYFKNAGNLSLNHLFESIRVEGIYIYEIYYVGFLEQFIGLNYAHLHFATQVFKMITAIFLYLLILKVFKKRTLAFFTSLIYTVSYTHAGVLFQLATGGYFVATIFMCLFLLTYFYAFTSKEIIKNSILSSVLLVITLILNPERMYPLIIFVLFLESCVIIAKRSNKKSMTLSLRRILIIISPLIIFYLTYLFFLKSIFVTGRSPGQFFIGLNLRIEAVMQGNWQLLLYPFTSLGSIFLHGEFWKLLGELNFQSFSKYTTSLLFGPILKLGIISFFLFSICFGKGIKLTTTVILLVFLFGLMIYFLFIHWQGVDPSVSIHFDPNFLTMPTIFGFYIFIFILTLFIEWIRNNDVRLVPPILGIFFAMLFIFFTWLPSDIQLTFVGTQRYLSIPAIGTSLFLAGILILVYGKLREIKFTKQLAWICFLTLIPLIVINYQIANNFFSDELKSAGLRATDQVRMQNKLRSMIRNISFQDGSLFYFDETTDKDNGYFDESTILAGFESWIRMNNDGTLNNFPEPGIIRTNARCPERTHKNCIDILKKGLSEVNGVKGIWYKDEARGQTKPRFYKLSNLYAYRFINKDFVDIRQEVLTDLNVGSLH